MISPYAVGRIAKVKKKDRDGLLHLVSLSLSLSLSLRLLEFVNPISTGAKGVEEIVRMECRNEPRNERRNERRMSG